MSIMDIKIHESFNSFFNRKEIKNEINKIDDILSREKYYPLENEVLRFATCDLNNTSCIILGMDPYPSEYKNDEGNIYPIATGRSFEVRSINSWTDKYSQTSLQNILKSLYYMRYKKKENISYIKKKIIDREFNIIPISKLWEDKKMIWLNATLTVVPHKSGSHEKYWSYFMDELIKYIVEKNHNIIWLIWGDNARNRIKDLVPKDKIKYTCHPASRVKNNFVEACPFQYIKDIEWICEK